MGIKDGFVEKRKKKNRMFHSKEDTLGGTK